MLGPEIWEGRQGAGGHPDFGHRHRRHRHGRQALTSVSKKPSTWVSYRSLVILVMFIFYALCNMLKKRV